MTHHSKTLSIVISNLRHESEAENRIVRKALEYYNYNRKEHEADRWRNAFME